MLQHPSLTHPISSAAQKHCRKADQPDLTERVRTAPIRDARERFHSWDSYLEEQGHIFEITRDSTRKPRNQNLQRDTLLLQHLIKSSFDSPPETHHLSISEWQNLRCVNPDSDCVQSTYLRGDHPTQTILSIGPPKEIR